jgi:hypothetical protein
LTRLIVVGRWRRERLLRRSNAAGLNAVVGTTVVARLLSESVSLRAMRLGLDKLVVDGIVSPSQK